VKTAKTKGAKDMGYQEAGLYWMPEIVLCPLDGSENKLLIVPVCC